MEVQQIKANEKLFGKSNYMWLCSKKVTMLYMSTKDEFRLRQALNKISVNEQIQVMKQLLTWLDHNPNAQALKIPEITLKLLEDTTTNKMLSDVSFSRMNSFRKSLRRFSLRPNKIEPTTFNNNQKIGRSVTFKEEPTVYSIVE
ncbi:uncharacterized protein LOC109596768 isoform X2 [Aethina tumida]|nr:uncharacterized protein LOC109596768 isoform X2 [Aethina tumida]